MLNAANAFECSIHHDCYAAAQCFTFFHATLHTQCGQSRTQHVCDCETDIERVKNWGLVHLRRSKGVSVSTPNYRMVAHCGKWRSPKGRAHALAIVVLSRKEDRVARPVGPSRRAHFWWRLI